MGDNGSLFGYICDDYERTRKTWPYDSSVALRDFIGKYTHSGTRPITNTNEDLARITGYTADSVRRGLKKLQAGGYIAIIPADKTVSRKREIYFLYENAYDHNGDAFAGATKGAANKARREAEREKKKAAEQKKKSDVPEFGSPDEVNAVMANDFSQLPKRAQPTTPKPPKNPTYQFDNPDELFEVFAREEWSATDALTVLRENSCLCKLPDERREEFIEINYRERLAPYYHGKSKPTPEQEASAREAAEILYQTIQTEQQRRIDDESRNF